MRIIEKGKRDKKQEPGFWSGLLQPVLLELKKGRSVPELALAITMGAAWGVFPVIGTSTVILILLTSLLRLNHPTVQVFNYLVYPLQVLFLIPFVRIGYLLSPGKFPGLTIEAVRDIFDDSWRGAIMSLADILLHGILGWFVVILPLSLAIYHIFRLLLKKYKHLKKNGI